MVRKSIEYFAFSILLIQLAGIVADPTKDAENARIVGGTATTIAKVPYVVQIWAHNKFLCGGTLVSARFVVSAAHCFEGLPARQVTVVGGASKLSGTGIRRRVIKIAKPKNYNMYTAHNDVAVLKLAKPLKGKNIRPIGLYEGSLKVGMKIKVSGWGRTSEAATRPSQQLRTVIVPVVAKAKCAKQYLKVGKPLTSSMFCASTPGAKDSCTGDSGGPAVCNGKLCGIVSFGIGCARRNFPGVYTNIQAVKAFIKRNMK